jgi:RNA polymerase-associated protein RTF1
MFPLDGIFRNARDKAYILALPQVKREEILAEREDQKQQQNFSAQLARRAKQAERDAQGLENKHKRKASSAELEENQRKNSRPKVKANQPLEAYKRQREQRDQLRERQNSHRNRARRGSSASKGSPDDSPRGGSSDVEWDEAAKAAQHNREHSPPNTNHYDAVRVGRLDFHETWSYPSFEKAMIGAFCRVGSGLDQATGRTLYRMAQIKGKDYLTLFTIIS